jgi:hypothetical protein
VPVFQLYCSSSSSWGLHPYVEKGTVSSGIAGCIAFCSHTGCFAALLTGDSAAEKDTFPRPDRTPLPEIWSNTHSEFLSRLLLQYLVAVVRAQSR